LVLLALVLTLPLAAYTYTVAGRVILPGVRAGGVDVAGLSVTDAARAIHETWNVAFRLTVVDASDPTRSWQAQPIEFGLSVDSAATAEQAYRFGHGSDLLKAVRELASSYEHGQEVAPVVLFEPVIARATLESWASRIYIPAREADLSINGGQVVAVPGSAGKALDVEAVMGLLTGDPSSVLQYGIIPLATTPVAPQILDASKTAEELERILEAETVLPAYDPVTGERFRWTPARDVKARWIVLERGPDSFRYSLDDTRIAEYVSALQAELGAERFLNADEATAGLRQSLQGGSVEEPLIVRYQVRAYKVRSTDSIVSIGFRHGIPYWKLQDFNPQLAVSGLVPGETLTIPPRDFLLTLPIIVDKRIVISIKEQRLRVYESGTMVKELVVSTGIDRSPTMPGIFQVQSHFESAYASRWDLTMPHFLGIYEAVPDFWNGIHGLPTLSNGVRLWGSVLGRPASYGCIILDLASAEELYNWAEEGTIVEITP
jgi:hypothetical protein